MPLYQYQCRRCRETLEQLSVYRDRDKPIVHEGCGGSLERLRGLELPTVGKSAFQTQVVLGNGDHLKGHFGKEAVRKKRHQ